MPLLPGWTAPADGIPLWAHFVLGGCLLVAGTTLVLFVRRNRGPSFIRDFALILGLALPLIGGAILWDLLLSPGTVWHDRGRLLLLLATSVLFIYGVSRFSVTAIRWWAARSDLVRESQTTLVRVAWLSTLLLGLLIVLEILKVPITPLLTTLGVGSFAIALALQDTLSNLFAGFYLTADRPMRVGDYVRLSSGEEGYVMEVGWRTTRFRTIRDNVIIVPNAKLAQASITNFDLPDRRIVVSIRIPIAYGQDARKAKRVLEAIAAAAVGQITGLAEKPPPEVCFDPGYGDLALEFTLSCHVTNFDLQTDVMDELRLRVADQFTQEGIQFVRFGPP